MVVNMCCQHCKRDARPTKRQQTDVCSLGIGHCWLEIQPQNAMLLQGEMQEALKAVDLGVAAAGAELKAAAKAGRHVVRMELTLTGNGAAPAEAKPGLRSLNPSNSRKGAGASVGNGDKADGHSQGSTVSGNLLLAKNPVMQKLAQKAIENEQAARAEGRMTNRNGIAYGFVPNVVVEEDSLSDPGEVQEAAGPQVQVQFTVSEVADDENEFSKVVGAFVANAEQQKAEISKRAYRTEQSVKSLALLLGEPPASEASVLLGSIIGLADSFDTAFAKIAGCAK